MLLEDDEPYPGLDYESPEEELYPAEEEEEEAAIVDDPIEESTEDDDDAQGTDVNIYYSTACKSGL